MSIFSKNKKIVLLIIGLMILVGSLFFVGVTFAVGPNADTFGLSGLEQNLDLGKQDIRITIAKIINVFLGILGIVAISIIVYAGYVYMTAGGNDEKVTQARNWIKNAVIGLAIILSAFAIVTFVINKLAEATGAYDPRCVDPAFALENPEICPDPRLNCNDPIYNAANPTICKNYCELLPQLCCGEKHFVVQSITPNTKNTQMNNVVVRALFSWPINEKYATSSLELAKTVKVFSGTTDVTTKFDFSLIENKRVIELKPNSTSGQKCLDGSNCLPFGTYKVQVQPVQSETGQSLESGQLSCGVFLTEVNFIVGERDKQGNVNLLFDGLTGGLNISNSSDFDFANKNITLSFWVKMPVTSNTTSSIPTILDHFGGGVSGVGGGWYVVRSGDKLLFNHRSAVNGGDLMLTSNSSVNDDKWHFITYTLDGTSTARVFIDGVFDKLATYNDPLNYVTKNLFVGNMTGVMNYWKGSLDDIRMYDQILSTSTITSLYSYGQADRTHYLDGLVAWWNFDESADQSNKIVIDFSNRSHSGTLSGNVLRQATPDFVAGGIDKDVTKPDLFDLKIDNNTSSVHSLRVSKYYRTYPVEAKIADDSGFSYAQLRVNELTKVNGIDAAGALVTQSVYYDGPLVVSSSDATVDKPYLLKLPLRLNEATYPNEKYIVTIEIHDIDNNVGLVSTIIDLTPDSCLDDVVGGVCGGGEGELCDYDTDCAYGFRCKLVDDDIKKTCTAYPIIEGVSPSMDGAIGNWVTVVGKNFGEDAGDIYFASGTEWIKAFNPCVNDDVWHDNWAVISVPGLSLDNIGAIKLTVANQTKINGDPTYKKEDVTNDDFGLEPGKPGLFTINTTKRPGLCNVGITEAVLDLNGIPVLPIGSNRGLVETEILASGQGLGTQRQNSNLWFGSGITKINSNINQWNDDTKVYAVVPSAAEVNNWYGVYAEIRGQKSNGIPFYIVNQDGLNGPIITSIEPASTTPGSFITIYGSRFGRNPGTVGRVWFARTQQDVLTCPTENKASSCFTANYKDFPAQCSDTWFDDHVIVGVPHDLFGAVFSNSVLNNLLALPVSDNQIGRVDANSASGYVVNTFNDTIASEISPNEVLGKNDDFSIEMKFILKSKPTYPVDNDINTGHDVIFGFVSNNNVDYTARFLRDNLGSLRFCFIAEQNNLEVGRVCDTETNYNDDSSLNRQMSYYLIKDGNQIKISIVGNTLFTSVINVVPVSDLMVSEKENYISIGKVVLVNNEMTDAEGDIQYVINGLRVIDGAEWQNLLGRDWLRYLFVMTNDTVNQGVDVCNATEVPDCYALNVNSCNDSYQDNIGFAGGRRWNCIWGTWNGETKCMIKGGDDMPSSCVVLPDRQLGSLFVNDALLIKRIVDEEKKYVLRDGSNILSNIDLLDISSSTIGFSQETIAGVKVWSKERFLFSGYYGGNDSSLNSFYLKIIEDQRVSNGQRFINRKLVFGYAGAQDEYYLPQIYSDQLQNLEISLTYDVDLVLLVKLNGENIQPEPREPLTVFGELVGPQGAGNNFWIGGFYSPTNVGDLGSLGLSYVLFNSLTLNSVESGDVLQSARPFILLQQNINDKKTEAGLLSSGNNQVTVVNGEPLPGLCGMSPTSGPAPLADGDELLIYGSNLSTTTKSNVFFDSYLVDNEIEKKNPSIGNGWLKNTSLALELPIVPDKSGGQSITTTIPSVQTEGGLYYSMRKNGPIIVQSNGQFTNSLPYDVIDCNLASSTEKTKMIMSGFQCCVTSGADLGKWKPSTFMCDGDKREAGYVWRFYTGKMPSLPSVVEECNEKGWNDDGTLITFPSPVPWTKWKSGKEACVNSTIAVRFNMGMDPASLNVDTVKVSSCGKDDNINCNDGNKISVAVDLVKEMNTLRIKVPPPNLATGTWYRVELKKDIQSLEIVSEFGTTIEFRYPLKVDTTKQCGDTEHNAYCYDFKTGAETCKLQSAGINPPEKNYSLLGFLQDARYPFIYTLQDIFAKERLNLFYYYVWGMGNQECSVLDVDGLGWNWASTNSVVAQVTPEPCLGGVNCPRKYTDSRAIANANSEGTAYLTASFTTSSETITATSTLNINLSEPKITNWWPNCENACANGSIGVQFNMTMMTSTYSGALDLYMCNNSTCTVTSTVPLSGDSENLFKENILEVLPASYLERNTWYKVVIKNQIRAVGGFDGNTIKSGKLVSQFSWIFRTKEFDAQCILDRVEVEPNPFSALEIGEKTKYSAVPYSTPDSSCSTVGQRLNPWSFGWHWSVGDARVATTTNYETGFERVFKPYCTANCLPKGSDVFSSQLNTTNALCGNGLVDIGEDCDIDANIPGGSIKEVAGVSCNYNCLRSGNNILNEGIGENLYVNGNFEDGLSGYEKIGVSYDSYLRSDGVFEPPDGRRVADISISLNSTRSSLIGQQIDNLNKEKIYTGSIFAFRNLIITTDLSLGIKSTSPDGTYVYFWNFISQNWDEASVDGFGFPIFSSDQIKNFSIPQGVWSEYNYSVPNNKGSLTFYWGLTSSQKSNRKIYLDKASLGINGKINTCGNGIVDLMSSEECDTGIVEQEAYCSNKCLWLGTGPFTGNVGPWCGDDLASIGKGEECDIFGPVTKVHCSSNCLHAGTTLTRSWCDKMGIEAPVECESAQSVCGNNHLETGEQCEIFGTSTLKFFVNDVVTSAVVSSTLINGYCNSQCRFGNICDLTAVPLAETHENKSLRCSNTLLDDNSEGCNDNCVLAGSNTDYSLPSLCANGKVEMGEYAYCEVSITTVSQNSLGENPVQTITAVGEQPIVSDSAITAQTTTIFARAISYFDPNTTTKKVNLLVDKQRVGEGEYGLTCGYTETEDGNDCDPNVGNVKGVAYNSCCYARPTRTAEYPKAQAGYGVGADGKAKVGVCRNTYLEFSFSGKVDEVSLKDNVHLVRGYSNTTTCPVGSTNVSETIVTNTIEFAFADVNNNIKNGFFDKVINFFKKIFVWLWPTDLARAIDESYGSAEYKDNLVWCESGTAMNTEVRYESREVLGEDGIYRSIINTSTISIQNNELLASSSYYLVLLDGGLKGIKNSNGVGIKGYEGSNHDLWIFKTSEDICKIKEITVEPKSHLFNVPLATTTLSATVHSENNQLIVTTTAYNWTWSWGPQNNTLLDIPVPVGGSVNDNSIIIGARKVEGFLSVIGQAEVASDGKVYYGNSDIRVKFCANPWPPLTNYPYEDKMLNDDGFNTSTNHFDGSTIPSANGKYFNFNISYCADKGSPSTTTDDLPLLRPYVYSGGTKLELPGADNRFYTVLDNLVVTQDTLKRVLFFNNKNEDLIGLQIFKNLGRQTAKNWFLAKFPQATGVGTVNVGGYEGVKDANNYYFNVFNIGENSKTVENFILQIGINTGAQGPTKEVFDQLIKSLTFNTNISDQHLCRAGTSGIFGSKRCDTDFDCYDTALTNLNDTCSADLTKFKRDWRRLADITAFQIKMLDFYQKNAFYPKLESGTYIRSYTVNRWPSWSELSSAVGGAPQDPLNIWVGCNAGADKQTCWVTSSTGSNVESYYSCPQKMSSYEYYYNNVSNTYSFYTPLEYFTKDIVLQNFSGEFIAKDAENSWIVNTPWCTSGTTFSPYSNKCGDGIINIASEECDPPGSVKAVASTTLGYYSTWACNSQCKWNVGVATTTYKCGNGIVEGTEACDDGALNGTYGNCAGPNSKRANESFVGACNGLHPEYCGDNIFQSSLEMCEVKDNVLVSYGVDFGRKCIEDPQKSCVQDSDCNGSRTVKQCNYIYSSTSCVSTSDCPIANFGNSNFVEGRGNQMVCMFNYGNGQIGFVYQPTLSDSNNLHVIKCSAVNDCFNESNYYVDEERLDNLSVWGSTKILNVDSLAQMKDEQTGGDSHWLDCMSLDGSDTFDDVKNTTCIDSSVPYYGNCGTVQDRRYTYLHYGDHWGVMDSLLPQCSSITDSTAKNACAFQVDQIYRGAVSSSIYGDKYCDNSGNVLVMCNNNQDCFGPVNKSFIFTENDFKTASISNILNNFTTSTENLGQCQSLSATKKFGAQYNFYKNLSCAYDCQNYGSYCGDGIVDIGEGGLASPLEFCDDGNNIAGDGCNAVCQTEENFCGNKEIDLGETCDDGKQCTNNKVCTKNSDCSGIGDGQCLSRSGDGCNNICKIEIRTGKYCGNGVIEDAEKCDQGEEKNGVVCIPGYGKSCNYCTANCDKIITYDSPAYCGNGKIDQLGLHQQYVPFLGIFTNKIYEECDTLKETNEVIKYNTSTQQQEVLTCFDKGKYECSGNCTFLSNNCTDCNFGSKDSMVVAKAKFLNVIWPSGMLGWLDETYNLNGVAELKYKNSLTGEVYSSAVNMDFNEIVTTSLIFSPKMNTNVMCNENYSNSFLAKKGAGYKLHLSEIDPITSGQDIESYVGATLDYPVNNEISQINNEYVISPPLTGPNQIRVVLHWTDKEMDDMFSLNVQSFAINSAWAKNINYLDLMASGLICGSQNTQFLGGTFTYNYMDLCTHENLQIDGVYAHEQAVGIKNRTQAMTIDITDKYDKYLFFVNNVDSNKNITKYLDSNLTMEIYKYKVPGTYKRLFYEPDQVIAIKNYLRQGQINAVANYWFAFELDPTLYRTNPLDGVTEKNKIKTAWTDICIEAYPTAPCSESTN